MVVLCVIVVTTCHGDVMYHCSMRAMYDISLNGKFVPTVTTNCDCRMREKLEQLHEHMRKDLKTNIRCRDTRLTRPARELVSISFIDSRFISIVQL